MPYPQHGGSYPSATANTAAMRTPKITACLLACRRQEQLLMDGLRMPTDMTHLGAILIGQILSTTMYRRILQCG
jgi:hypothetical protein